MINKIPPLTNFETGSLPDSVIKPYRFIHSMATNIKYISMGENRKNETHCIFHYTLKGQGEVLYNGASYKTKAGEGFFNIINEPGSGYRYPENSDEIWEFFVICFEGGNIREVVKELLESKVVFKIENCNNFYHLCQRLIENPDNNSVLTFFSKFLSLILNTSEEPDELCFKFQKIVDRDLNKNPTIAAIASEMNISREHLQREYYKLTGKTPARYISDKRFEQLCSYLLTDMSEKKVAETMNFSSVSGMNVFFKKYTGTTLGKYRKNGYFTI